jgi:hypothetical protein
MMSNFEDLKKQLSELATLLNAFKSEAVQLRIVDRLLGEIVAEPMTTPDERRLARRRRPASKPSPSAPGKSRKRKPAASGTGAVATLTELAAGDFFKTPRTINDIIAHCRDNLARTFKANEFSGKLGRMVRDNDLGRKKNANGQYEYKKK